MDIQPVIISAGLVIGALIGLTGMGGGALMTPFLILIGVRPSVAVGTDLVQMMFTKSFGAWQHRRQGTMDYRLVFLLAVGSIPGAFLGVGLLVLLKNYSGISIDSVLPHLWGGVLTLVGIVLLVRILVLRRMSERKFLQGGMTFQGNGKYLLPAVGMVMGILVGLISVGSGSLFMVTLTLLVPLSMRTIVGTDVAHSALLTATAGLLHLGVGHGGPGTGSEYPVRLQPWSASG